MEGGGTRGEKVATTAEPRKSVSEREGNKASREGVRGGGWGTSSRQGGRELKFKTTQVTSSDFFLLLALRFPCCSISPCLCSSVIISTSQASRPVAPCRGPRESWDRDDLCNRQYSRLPENTCGNRARAEAHVESRERVTDAGGLVEWPAYQPANGEMSLLCTKG